MRFPFDPFPELYTPRLRLRQPELSDSPALFLMRSSALVMQYVSRPLHTNLAESQALLERIIADLHREDGITWAICRANHAEMIGTIGLWQLDKLNHRGEIGYMLHADFWGRGFVAEALEAVEEFGFREMNLHSIEAHLDPEHTASIRVLEKRGFVQEAHFRENFLYGGKFLDTLVYGKLNPLE